MFFVCLFWQISTYFSPGRLFANLRPDRSCVRRIVWEIYDIGATCDSNYMRPNHGAARRPLELKVNTTCSVVLLSWLQVIWFHRGKWGWAKHGLRPLLTPKIWGIGVIWKIVAVLCDWLLLQLMWNATYPLILRGPRLVSKTCSWWPATWYLIKQATLHIYCSSCDGSQQNVTAIETQSVLPCQWTLYLQVFSDWLFWPPLHSSDTPELEELANIVLENVE